MIPDKIVQQTGRVLLMASVIMGTSVVNAQSTAVALQTQQSGAQKSAGVQRGRVTLDVKDQSIEWIIRTIGQQANLRVAYNSGLKELQKRISLSVKNTDAFDAILIAIRGTRLEAAMTSDGTGVMISERSTTDSTLSNSSVRTRGTIQGSVIDSSTRKGIEGATAQITTLGRAVLTDKNGSFIMNDIPTGTHTVNVKLLGYVSGSSTVTVSPGKTSTVQIILRAVPTALSGVVTTATGVQRKIEVAHDIAKIDPQVVMQRAPVRTFTDLMEAAQIPGVLVQRQSGDPGAPTKIRIRGIGSIAQSNDPVIILDGVWIDASVSAPSRLDDIDPSSIESVEIVRGPSAATLYGQDASNGVIIITTKRGRVGPSRWNLSYSRDWGQTYGTIPKAYLGFGHDNLSGYPMRCPISFVLQFSCLQDSVVVYNPNDPLFDREGGEINNRMSVQVEGGANSITYAITAAGTNTIGVRRIAPIQSIRFRKLGYSVAPEFTQPSALKRRNITANMNMSPRSNLTIGLTVSGTQSKVKNDSIGHSIDGINDFAQLHYSPDTIAFLERRNRIRATESPSRSDAAIIGGTVRWQPRETWVVNGTVGYERTNSDALMYRRYTLCDVQSVCMDTVGEISQTSTWNTIQTARFNASTSLKLGRLSRLLDIRPSFGADYRETDYTNLNVYKTNVPPGERSMSATGNTTVNRFRTPNATAGWYLNSMIGLFSRIYFDLGIRQDIGSAITSSSNTKYPKLGGSWLVSDEGFWRQNDFVNLLRLRAAVGHSAVQPDVADIHGRYLNGYEFVDGKYVRSVNLRGAGNPDLEPERATEFELGFDTDLLSNRVNIIATYAHSENVNTLIVREMPPSTGSTYGDSRKENVARIRNRNFELSSSARIIETSKALLVLNYNMTLSDNVVRKLGTGILPFSNRSVSRIEQGYPVAGVWVREVLGYRDSDGNGMLGVDEVILSDSAVYVGWSQPRYRASYGLTVTLMNRLTFDTRFAYQSRYVQQYLRSDGYGAEDVNAPLPYQAATVVDSLTGRRPVSDLRWTSASVTYQVPRSILQRLRARSLSISLQGSNLNLWTNYSGRDPGVNSALRDSEMLTDNGFMTPRPRLFVLDFKLGL